MSFISAMNAQAFNELKKMSNKINCLDISKVTGAGGASHQVNGNWKSRSKLLV
jgi:hypothetical protein